MGAAPAMGARRAHDGRGAAYDSRHQASSAIIAGAAGIIARRRPRITRHDAH